MNIGVRRMSHDLFELEEPLAAKQENNGNFNTGDIL